MEPSENIAPAPTDEPPRPDPPNARRVALLLAVALVAGLLRFAGLERVPAGLFRDEAEKGYNAWTLAREGGVLEFAAGDGGRAELQFRALPGVVNVFGVKTSALYQYASIPFVRLGGLSAATTRMAAALAGTLTVALLGLLLLRLWPAGYALAAAAWLALCPWHWLFSRWAAQGIFVPLGLVALLWGLHGVERERRWGWPLAGAALGFMFYAYAGAQPFVLLLGAALIPLYRRAIAAHRWGFVAALAAFAALAAPRAWVVAFGGGGARLKAVAVWGAEDATALNTLARFAGNYLAHFNPIFLFFDGDDLPRHGIPGLGQLLLIDLALLPIGLWASFRQRLPLARVLLAVFLIGPIGAAITRIGIPHALRALPMALPAAVWGGIGLATALRWMRARMAQSGRAGPGRVLAAVFALLALGYALSVYAEYRRVYRDDPLATEAFEASVRRAMEQVAARREEGQRVFVSVGILYGPYHVLFHERFSAREVAEQGLESKGYVFFDPRTPPPQLRRMLRPGDWLVAHNAAGRVVAEQHE